MKNNLSSLLASFRMVHMIIKGSKVHGDGICSRFTTKWGRMEGHNGGVQV